MNRRRVLSTALLTGVLILSATAESACPAQPHHTSHHVGGRANPCPGGPVVDPNDSDTWCYLVHAPGGSFHVLGHGRVKPYLDDPKYRVERLAP